LPTQRDYYAVLQVNPAAGQESIDAAYARLSRIYDPSTSRKPRANLRKQELDEAYAVLSDRRRRADYDRLRSKGLRPHEMDLEAGPGKLRELVYNPYVFAGVAGGAVLIILVVIVLISVLGGGGNENGVSQPSGSPTATSAAPATPPAVTGNEVTAPSGLKYIDIQEGTGASPRTGQYVTVNYTGWLQSDNTKFDSSLDRNQPFTFQIGQSNVIKGWDEGVATMKVGGKRRLTLPPDLAYGNKGAGGKIGPNATLIFDVDLLDVGDNSPTPSPTPVPQPSPTAPAQPSAT